MAASAQNPSVWSGVYERFDQVLESNGLFDTDLWTKRQIERAQKLMGDLDPAILIPQATTRDYPLAPLIAALLAEHDTLSMLDYGGAMGQVYIDLLAKVPAAVEKLKCTVIETRAVVEAVPAALRNLPNLGFITDVKELTDRVEIIHFGSVLQYIENWAEFLEEIIISQHPDIIALSDLLVGDIPTFVTAQTYGDRIIPVRFINVEDFLKFWAERKYRLIYRSSYNPLGGDDYFPTHGLPETHRIRKACHMIFKREHHE